MKILNSKKIEGFIRKFSFYSPLTKKKTRDMYPLRRRENTRDISARLCWRVKISPLSKIIKNYKPKHIFWFLF